jgi:hypothetical protein
VLTPAINPGEVQAFSPTDGALIEKLLPLIEKLLHALNGAIGDIPRAAVVSKNEHMEALMRFQRAHLTPKESWLIIQTQPNGNVSSSYYIVVTSS